MNNNRSETLSLLCFSPLFRFQWLSCLGGAVMLAAFIERSILFPLKKADCFSLFPSLRDFRFFGAVYACYVLGSSANDFMLSQENCHCFSNLEWQPLPAPYCLDGKYVGGNRSRWSERNGWGKNSTLLRKIEIYPNATTILKKTNYPMNSHED